jgi:transposase
MSGRQGKNDAADAQAIGKAMQRPNMRFVPVKAEDQQSRLAVHRARQGFVQARTATVNRIRGLLSEFGIVLPLKADVVRAEARTTLRPGGFARLCVLGAKAVLSNFIDESLCNSS